MRTLALSLAALAFTWHGIGRRVHPRSEQAREISQNTHGVHNPRALAIALLAFDEPVALWSHSAPCRNAAVKCLTQPFGREARRPTNAIVACASEDDLANLHAWLESEGITTSAVKGGRLPGFGLSLVSEGVESGSQLLSVPASLHITPSSVRDSPIGQAVSSVVPQDDSSGLLALGLLQEVAKGNDSVLAPYINILPTVQGMNGLPLLWTADELDKLFAGSHLQSTVTEARNGLLAQWQAIEQSVLPNHPESVFPRDVFNAPGYLWAHAICLTRALPFGDELSLIPYLDLANHKSGSKNVCSIGVVDQLPKTDDSENGDSPTKTLLPVTDPLQLEGKEGVAVLTAGEAIPHGDQVFIDYGEAGWRSSWEMLYTYGFVPGDTKEQWLLSGGRPIYFEGVREDDPLVAQKRALLTALGVDEMGYAGTWVDLNSGSKAPYSMAPLLRLAHLSPEGNLPASVAKMAEDLASWNAPPRETWERLLSPLDSETESSVAGQILGECEKALALLPSVEELAIASVPPTPADTDTGERDVEQDAQQERVRLAARVLLGERCALENTIAVWKKQQEMADSQKVSKPPTSSSRAGAMKRR